MADTTLRAFLGGRIFPPANWWFGTFHGPDHPWWRRHVPAHVGHGAYFYVVWWAPLVLGLGLAGLDVAWWVPFVPAVHEAVLWETLQREYWWKPGDLSSDMPLWSSLWDGLLAVVGSGLAAFLLTCMELTR